MLRQRAYRTGMNAYGGFIRHVRPGELAGVFGGEEEQNTEPPPAKELPTCRKPAGPERQLELF